MYVYSVRARGVGGGGRLVEVEARKATRRKTTRGRRRAGAGRLSARASNGETAELFIAPNRRSPEESDRMPLLCSALLRGCASNQKTNLLALGCFCLCHLVMCRGGRPEAREAAACCAAAAAAAAPIRLEVYGWLAVAGSCLLLPLSSRLRRTWWCY